ncbi:MAG: CRTAC1 family protein [Planctomycetes bacterium]|nr:CRTAC1 family protein [Planctomycetota bacterium]
MEQRDGGGKDAFTTTNNSVLLKSFTADSSANKKSTLARTPRADDWFEDASERSGIQFSYHNGREGEKYTLLESIGGGVALIDFDSDDDVDLFITGGGTIGGVPATAGLRPALYRNDGDWRFVDVTDAAGLAASADYSLGCSSGDFDRDGHPDLFVSGYPRSRLLRNTGKGTFEDVTDRVGLNLNGLHTASAWPDVNNDGWPDLFVAGYVTFDLNEGRQCGDIVRKIKDICGIWQYPPAPDRLFLNRQGQSFEEISQQAGIRADGKGLGVVASDFNEDGHIDLYVANDYTANHLYLGSGGTSFHETGLLAGVAVDESGIPQGSMGVDVGDYDGDGRGDIFVTNYQMEDNILYKNLGDAQFSVASGGAIGLRNDCRTFVGFGTGFADLDSDGWLDLFVFNGHVMYRTGQSPYEQPSFLFRSASGTRFENVTDRGGPYFSLPHVARGAAVGDLDGDGAPDLVIVHQNAPVVVLRNRLSPPNWTGIQLKGIQSEPHAVGATVTVSYQGRKLVRHVRSGAGYLSQFDRRILVPTVSDEPIQCEVHWLAGRREIFRNLAPRRTNILVEGEGEDGL